MSLKQQIEELKGYAINLSDELEWVIQSLELVPAGGQQPEINQYLFWHQTDTGIPHMPAKCGTLHDPGYRPDNVRPAT